MAASVGGQAALLRGDLGFGSADGWTTVWALTPEGFEVGAARLDLKLERVPKHDVGQAFRKREVMVNEVFLDLVPQDGKTPAKVPRHFRWILGEYLNLPFEAFDQVALRLEKRRLQPDAMLEDPAHQRRYFIEYQTGSATINDAKKSTSTSAKPRPLRRLPRQLPTRTSATAGALGCSSSRRAKREPLRSRSCSTRKASRAAAHSAVAPSRSTVRSSSSCANSRRRNHRPRPSSQQHRARLQQPRRGPQRLQLQ